MLFFSKSVNEDKLENLLHAIDNLESIIKEKDAIISGLKETVAESVIFLDEQKENCEKIRNENNTLTKKLEKFKSVNCRFILNSKKDIVSIERSYKTKPYDYDECTTIWFMKFDGSMHSINYGLSRDEHNMLCEEISKSKSKFLII